MFPLYLRMFRNVALVFFLFTSVLALDFLSKSKTYNSTKTKFSRNMPPRSSLKQSKVTMDIPQSNEIPQKHACPPLDPPTTDDSVYKECDDIKNLSELSPHPDQYKLTPEILETHGYSYAEYKVTTKDGYILTVYRITGSPKLKTYAAHKTPVYVNHGLIAASDWWLFHSPEKNMVLMMADEGYDVWLSNARGSSYSLEHETLDYNKDWESYWEFSFHEMGIYDVPAVTDRILNESNHTTILYFGYSMGTTELFISLSELPDMNEKIKAAFLVAPVAYMGHSPSVLRYVAAAGDTEEMFRPVNMAFTGRIRSTQDLRKMIALTGSDFCVTSAAKCGLCDNVLFVLNGVNPSQLNRTIIPFFLEKAPNSASYKTCVHFGQLMTSCRFQKFEYTPAINLKKYGSLRPPLYNLKNVRSLLYLYHGEQDVFGIPMDVHETVKHLSEGVLQKLVLVPDRLFTHFDFAIAKDAYKLVYRGVLNDMRKYIENI